MKYFHRLILLAFTYSILLVGPAQSAQNDTPFILAVYPHSSARALVTAYQPVRDYLKKTLHRPVQIYTAPDFKNFIRDTQSGQFDVVVTPPHLARLAQQEAGYIPMLDYGSRHSCVIVVKKDNPISEIVELRGKTITIPDPLSLVALVGLKWLQAHNLKAGTDFRLLNTPSHAAAVSAVESGKSVAAIINAVALKRMDHNLANSVRILTTLCDYSDALYLGNPKLSAEMIEHIKASLMKFANESDEGKHFLEVNNLRNMHPVKAVELERMDPYVPALKQTLEQSP